MGSIGAGFGGQCLMTYHEALTWPVSVVGRCRHLPRSHLTRIGGTTFKETPVEDEIQETETGYLVSLPMEGGFIRLAVEDVYQQRSDEIKCSLNVWVEAADVPFERFSARLNLLSLGKRTEVRRELDNALGKEFQWAVALNRTCSLVEHHWKNRERSFSLNGVYTPEAVFLCEPYLVRGANIFFGQGNSGKTWLGLVAACGHARGTPFLGGEWVTPGPVLYVDYEADRDTLSRRCALLGGAPEELRYWAGGGVPLAEQVPAIKTEVRKRGIQFIVVDSAGLAVGGKPEEAELAIRYYNALKQIDLPSLTIAHQRKDGEKDETPFGSQFWHSNFRQIWKVRADDQEDSDVRNIALFHTKWNNVPRREKPVGVRMFPDGTGVQFRRTAVADYFDEVALSQPQRIRKLLTREGDLKTAVIAETLSLKPSTVRTHLTRMKDVGPVGKEGRETVWRIYANQP